MILRRRREYPNIIPWEGKLKGYTIKTVLSFQRELITVGFDIDDGVQEGWVIYSKCCSRYKDSVKSPANFMTLYKKSLYNRLINIIQTTSPDIQFNSTLFQKVTDIHSIQGDANLRVLFGEMPKEISQFISIVFNTPMELVKMLGLDLKRKRGFSNNRALCSFFGYDHKKINIPKLVKQYFR